MSLNRCIADCPETQIISCGRKILDGTPSGFRRPHHFRGWVRVVDLKRTQQSLSVGTWMQNLHAVCATSVRIEIHSVMALPAHSVVLQYLEFVHVLSGNKRGRCDPQIALLRAPAETIEAMRRVIADVYPSRIRCCRHTHSALLDNNLQMQSLILTFAASKKLTRQNSGSVGPLWNVFFSGRLKFKSRIVQYWIASGNKCDGDLVRNDGSVDAISLSISLSLFVCTKVEMTFSLPPQTHKSKAAKARRQEVEQSAEATDGTTADANATRLPLLQDARSNSKQQSITICSQGKLPSNQWQHQRESAARVDTGVLARKTHRRKKERPGAVRESKKSVSGVHTLSPMDEQILILYHSSLKRSWASETPQSTHELAYFQRKYGCESTYAATQIQKMVRGAAARTRLAAFNGPRYQRAARCVQYAFRRLAVCRRVFRRLQTKQHAKAVRIQAWYRGCKCRDNCRDEQARSVLHRIILFQRHCRGRRFWRVVAAMLHDRRMKAATVIQRCIRGWRGRQVASAARFEQQRYVRNLVSIVSIHQKTARCERCTLEQSTEESLFDCFMARYVGLHDFKGAKVLCSDGLTLFPSSAKFCFFYAMLLQVTCDDVGVAMAYLNKALHMLHLSDDEWVMVSAIQSRCILALYVCKYLVITAV